MLAMRDNIRKNQASWLPLALQFAVIALLLAVLFAHWNVGLDYTAWIYPACVSIAVLFIWSVWSWKMATGSVFDPYVLFIIAAVLFNGGQAVLEIFNLNQAGLLANKFEDETLARTLFLVILCLSSFHLGALLSAVNVGGARQNIQKSPRTIAPKYLRWVGWALIAISILPTMYVLGRSVTVVVSSSYSNLYAQESSYGINAAPQILMKFLIPGCLFLLAGSELRRREIVVSGVILLLYSLTLYFLGSRSWSTMPLILYAWIWHHHIRPIPRGLLLTIGALVMFIVFPLIGATRNAEFSNRSSFEFLLDTFSAIDNPAVASISEMGGSMQTVAYTLELVPAERPIDYGASYFYASLAIIPNLFWDVHPAVVYGRPSDWLIWEVDPFIARSGGGLGFSFIAEAYLNFGWYSPLVMVFFGFLFGRLTVWAITSDEPLKAAMVACLFASALFWVRQEFLNVIRPLLWYGLVPYMAVMYLHYGIHNTLRYLPKSSPKRNETIGLDLR